jgi:flagellar protein FlaJ
MIIYVMVPMLQSQATATGGLSSAGFSFVNPCESGMLFPCGFFGGICAVFGLGSGIACYYVAVFFSVVLVQGIFTGLIAGQLGENSPISGIKHSLIMSFAAVGTFLFLAKIGFFPG